jgi:small subunit ribosomal protein S6
MNIECDNEALSELEHAFKFNDAVLRHLTVFMDEAVTTPSAMMKEEKSRSISTTSDDAAKQAAAQPPAAPAQPATRPQTTPA